MADTLEATVPLDPETGEPVVNVISPSGERQFVSGNAALVEALRGGYKIDPEQPNFRGVTVETPQGYLEVSPEEAEKRILSGGGRIGSFGDLERQREEQIYNAPWVAGAAGLSRGLTLGISDWAARSSDPAFADDLARLQAANPRASLGGEVLGSAAPLLLSGGGFGAGSLAARGAARLGGGALAQTVTRGAASAAVETALLSAGQEVSAASLQNREIEASKVTEAFGHGLLVGGLLGGGLSLVGAGARATVDAFKNKLSPFAESLLSGDLKGELRKIASQKIFSSTGGSEATLAELAAENPEVRKAAEKILVEEAATSLGKNPLLPLSKEEALQGVKIIQKEARAQISEVLAKTDAAAAATGITPDIPAIVKKAEEGVLSRLEPRFFTSGKGAAREVQETLAEISSLRDYRLSWSSLRDLGEELGVLARTTSDKGAANAYRGMQAAIQEEVSRGLTKIGEVAGGDFRAQLSELAAKDRASTLLEEALEYGVKNSKTPLENLLTVASGVGGRSTGGALVGGALGSLLGSPGVGAQVGGVLGGVAGGVGKLLKSEYGDQLVGRALREFSLGNPSRLGALLDAVTQKRVFRMVTMLSSKGGSAGGAVGKALAEKSISDSETRNVLEGSPTRRPPKVETVQLRTSSPPRVLPVAERVKNAREALTQRTPTATKNRITEEQIRGAATLLKTLKESTSAALLQEAEGAPEAVRAVIQGRIAANERATNYLLSKIPRSGNLTASLTPHLEAPRMAAAEVSDFLEAVKTVENPLSVLESVEKGELSRTQVEALQVAAPQIYKKIVSSVELALSQLEEPLPYHQAVQLSLLLGVAGHPSLEPATMRWLQEAYTSSPTPTSPPPPPRSQLSPTRGRVSFSQDWKITREEP